MTFFNYIKVCLLSLLIFGAGFNASATHLAAADIHVDYVPTKSPYTYRITLNVYKSCEYTINPGGDTSYSADLVDETTLTWASASGCLPGNSIIMRDPIKDTLDQLCDSFKAKNSCRDIFSIFPAFVRHRWVIEVELPGACPDWIFSWILGNRNDKIKNLQLPDSWSLLVDAMINNSKKARVSTPRYTIDPIPYFCGNYRASFPNGPMDPDNDSMVSINANPRGPGPIPYNCLPPSFSIKF